MKKQNLFPIALVSCILLASLALMYFMSPKEMDYYARAESLGLAEIIDSPDLTMEMLENRNGKLIIEKAVGVVTNAETGEGYIIGWPEFYISYASTPGEIHNGDVICSYFIYNPDNNYCDDIMLRFDYIIDDK